MTQLPDKVQNVVTLLDDCNVTYHLHTHDTNIAPHAMAQDGASVHSRKQHPPCAWHDQPQRDLEPALAEIPATLAR